MTDWRDFFKDKTVTQVGLGLLGRGLGDAAFLAQHCKKLIVTDSKSAEELRPSLEALKQYKNIEFAFGGHDYKHFENVDFVLKGAGVRLDNPYIARAKENGIPVHMSTALFTYLAPLKTVGITGTRGKTTTTSMIVEILRHAEKKALLGGNIRGVSTLALLPEATQYDIAVLELDSWQLQGFDELGISPNIAVFTNFYPDHMNYYDGDMNLYLRDKTAILRHQKKDDTAVVSEQIAAIVKHETPAVWIVAQPLAADLKLKIPGAHNRENAALAKGTARQCGVADGTIEEALRGFQGVEGRLQPAGSWQARDFYNDSNSTTQEATLAALSSFPPASIVLIFGGADKGLPLDAMLDFIASHKIRAVLFKGTGSDRVLKKLPQLPVSGSMQEAVKLAKGMSRPGDRVILSPAFASFGMFKNEYDRSDQFMEEIRKLIAGKESAA